MTPDDGKIEDMQKTIYNHDQTKFSRRVTVQLFLFLAALKSQWVAASIATAPTFKKSWLFSPKDAQTRFKNLDEFWQGNQDLIAYQLNAFFNKSGWLQRQESQLMPGNQQVVLTKEYKSRYHYELYEKLWHKLSAGEIKEIQCLVCQDHTKDLF